MPTPPPEITLVDIRRVWCDGATDIRSGKLYRAASLGHPKVYLQIDEHGYVDCGYCDRRFVLKGGPADGADQASLPDITEGGDPGTNTLPTGGVRGAHEVMPGELPAPGDGSVA